MRTVGDVLKGWVEGLCGNKTNPLSIIASADAAVGRHGLKGGVDLTSHLFFLTELAMEIKMPKLQMVCWHNY